VNLVTNDAQSNWEDFGIYASTSGMATNITHLARTDASKQSAFNQKIAHELYSGPLNLSTLYILGEWKNAPDKESYNSIRYNPQTDLLASINGFNVLAPGWKNCKNCLQIDKSMELKQLAPSLKIGEIIQFTKAGNGRSKFMLNGWGYTEDWGTWAIEPTAKVVLPMPDGSPRKLIISANAFLTPGHPEQKVDIYINGIKVADQLMLTKQIGNLLELALPSELKTVGKPVNIEFRSINPISPLAAGISGDDRRLGIGLISIQFAH
jgi:hypothetical protein